MANPVLLSAQERDAHLDHYGSGPQRDHGSAARGILIPKTSPDSSYGILVARHLKTTDDLFDSCSSPRTESLVAAAVQWAERIMRKIDGVFGK
jgi:hypothetical protein